MGNSLAQGIDHQNRRKFEDPKFVNALAENIDFDRLATSLRDSGAVTEAMIDDIRKHTKLEERNRRLLQHVSERGPYAYKCFLDVLHNNGMSEALSLLKGWTPLHQGLPANTRCVQVRASGPGGEPVFSNPGQSNDDVTTGEASEVEVEVIPATELKRGPNIYPMERKPRGRCLIMNNHNFKELPRRNGSDVDADRMEKLFTALHFQCKIFRDLTADGMMEELSKAAQEEQQKAADCLVVVLMSHGGTVTMRGSDNEPLPEQCIYGSDDEPIPLYSIYELFNNKNCPSLLGKPKLFFIQACRGGKLDAGTAKHVPRIVVDAYPLPSNTESDPGTRGGFQRMPAWTDIYICYVLNSNYKAHRNTATRSWFLSAVCSVFSQRACDMHLLDLMLYVQRRMLERASFDGIRQTPCSSCLGWRKDLYFNPGLPVDPIPPPTPCTEQQTMKISV
ncbi:caspase-3-like [Haemaphysalis longicornis]